MLEQAPTPAEVLTPIIRGTFMAYPRPSQSNGVQHYDIEHYETAMGTTTGRITSCTGRSCPTPGWFVVTTTGVLRTELGTVSYYPTPEAALDAFIASLG